MAAESGSQWSSVVNLANSIVGVSVLAMPYCFKECGIVLGPLLLMLAGYLTRKSCHFLMKAGNVAKRRSYEFLALHSFGAAGKLAVELCTIGLMLATCVGFFVIIGDLAPVIVAKLLDRPPTPTLRTIILFVTAFGIALPLGLLRKISSLTSVSSLSFGFYFSLVVFLFFQALPNLFSGVWNQGPRRIEYWRPSGILKSFPIFGLAFACQTQLFPIYESMSDPTLKKMVGVIDSAVHLVACIYLSVGFFGLIAFYDTNVVGDILLSFRPSILGEVIKLGFVVSVAVSFPLVIFPCRLSINSLLCPPAKKGPAEVGSDEINAAGVTYIPPLRFKAITLGIVLTTLIIGINVPGIESILGLVGGTVGVFISFIFPSTMFLIVTSLTHGEGGDKIIGKIVLVTGVAIMVSSTYLNLTERSTPPSPEVIPSRWTPPPMAHGPDIPAKNVGARQEPALPQEPDNGLPPKEPPEGVDVAKEKGTKDEVAASKEADKKPPDKEDYDALQRKIDAAEEKHDVLLQQLVKQQEQQKIIMEQQHQIIQQLKANKEQQAADEKKPAAVTKEVAKTEKQIEEANQALDRVAKEVKDAPALIEKGNQPAVGKESAELNRKSPSWTGERGKTNSRRLKRRFLTKKNSKQKWRPPPKKLRRGSTRLRS